MKLLKETTKARYSNTQLLKHLDRLSDFVSDYNEDNVCPLRIDLAYGSVHKFDFDANAYYFRCSADDRDSILDLVNRYSAIVERLNELQIPKLN